MVQSEELNHRVRQSVPEQGLAFDSLPSSDLTAGQYRNLLDLAQLALSQPTREALFPRLALRLQDALNFDFVTLGLYDSSTESIRLNIWKAGEARKTCECLPVHTCASGWVWKNQRLRTCPRFGRRTQVARFPRVASPTRRSYLLCLSLDHESSQAGGNRVWQFACHSQDECDA